VGNTSTFDLLARDRASGPVNKVGDAFEKTSGKARGLVTAFGAVSAGTRGLHSTFGLIGKGAAIAAGAAGLGGLIEGFKGVYQEGREAQKVGAQTAAVIKSTGGIAKVSAVQVGALAESISNKVGVDDEAIQSGENMLLTFTKVRNEAGKGNRIFDQATETITDMAAAMNHGVVTTDGLQKASIQVGKSLNDPIKGITALTKVGVTFTQKQKEQIKSLVEHGHALDAQKVILGELNREFGGSAEAGTTAVKKLGVVFGNIQESIGTALLPSIDKAATWFSKKLPGAVATAGRVIGPIVRTLVSGFSGLAAAFSGEGVTSDGFVGVMENIGVVGKRIVDYVKGTVVPGVVTAFGGIKTKVGAALSGIDLSGIAKAFTAQATTWGTALITGVRTGLDTGDWSALGQTVGKGIAAAIEGAGQFAKMIAGKIGDLLGKVDWVGIGISLGKQAPSLLIGLAAGILNFDFKGLLKGVAAHWQDILIAVIAVALAPARIIGKVGELLAHIPFVGKLLEWALLTFKKFSDGAVSIVGKAIGGVVRFIGREFMVGFRSVFPAVGKAFSEWLGLFPTRIGVIALDIRAAALRMVRRLGQAILDGAGWVIRNITQLIAQMLQPWVNAGRWLVNAGLNVIRGLGRGLAAAWPAVWRWIGGLGGAISKAFNLAGNWLITAGYNVIGGLWSGFKSAMGGVGRILGSVKDAIVGGLKRLFGIQSPSTVMAGIGVHIITGLIKGLLTQSGALARTVKSIGGTVTGIFPSLIGATQSTSSGSMQAMVKGYAQLLYGWAGRQWDALNMLLTRESGFNPNAQNPTSTAYGLFQFLDGTWAGVNATKTSNPQMQTLAGLRYIKQRYGDPVGAWNHELMAGWYGGGMPPTVFSRPTLIGVGDRGPETVTVTPHSPGAGGGLTVAQIQQAFVAALQSVGLTGDGVGRAVVTAGVKRR
jgi:muramidase (phage lysozyme)